jgi:hypothetical protein
LGIAFNKTLVRIDKQNNIKLTVYFGMNRIITLFKAVTLPTILWLLSPHCHAQKILNQPISIHVKQRPVAEVLKLISEQGKFYFSYNSNLIPEDSLVTLTAQSKPVRQVLDILLAGTYQYKETGNYIIIQHAPKEKYYYLTGQIFDHETGKEVDYASVYSRQQLVSALSDDHGFFRMRLRDRNFPLNLTISKVGYADTVVVINSERETNLRITVSQKAIDLDPLFVRYSEGEGSWLTRLLISSKLRLQSRNIGRFFVSLPYQASLTPGLSTHGKMSSQVVNKFSLNLIGGYTAGVNGAEIAGIFNISRQDAHYFQVAGLFNIVTGDVHGFQIAGFYNQVQDTLQGVQVSGFASQINKQLTGVQVSGFLGKVSGGIRGIQLSGAGNIAKDIVNGGQISGIFNTAAGPVKGFQLSGVFNNSKSNFSGVQIAGIGNNSRKETAGLQLAGLNYAKNLKGVQIGIINIADSSSGYSIGLINIVKKGKGAFSLYASEVLPVNMAWKSGNWKLYGIFTVGTGIGESNKAYAFGFGFGKEVRLNNTLSVHAELINQNFYLGEWKTIPILYRLHTGLNINLTKRISLFAGPAFSLFNSSQKEFKKGYDSFSDKGFSRFKINSTTNAWLGWQGGLSWNYGRLL